MPIRCTGIAMGPSGVLRAVLKTWQTDELPVFDQIEFPFLYWAIRQTQAVVPTKLAPTPKSLKS